MLKLFSKLGTVSGLLTGTFFINFDKFENSNLITRDKSKSEEFKLQVPENIGSLDDIKLFERKYGCSFIFVKSWKKEHYRFEEFLEKEKSHDRAYWKERVIKGANSSDAQEACKKGETIALFNADNQNGFVSNDYTKFKQ